MPARQFTLEEAERLLPRLTELIAEIRAAKQEYDRFERQVSELTLKMRGNGHVIEDELREAQRGLEQAVGEVNDAAGRVRELGCELKDIELGLIDFPADMDGRVVYLCWKIGEERIDWWHELEAGFAGRQPLPGRPPQ